MGKMRKPVKELPDLPADEVAINESAPPMEVRNESAPVADLMPAVPDEAPEAEVHAALDITPSPVMISVPKKEFAALMYALVTGNYQAWIRQAALTRFGRMLGAKTYDETLVIWQDMKNTFLGVK
jgi:hypothetical protein